MKTKGLTARRVRPLLALAALVALLVNGCAARRAGGADAPRLPVDVTDGRAVRIAGVEARVEAQTLVVTGRVERLFPSPVHGHVDVVLVDAAGNPAARTSVGSLAGCSRRGGRQQSSFTARLPGPAPDGARVRVRYHAKGHVGQERRGRGKIPADESP